MKTTQRQRESDMKTNSSPRFARVFMLSIKIHHRDISLPAGSERILSTNSRRGIEERTFERFGFPRTWRGEVDRHTTGICEGAGACERNHTRLVATAHMTRLSLNIRRWLAQQQQLSSPARARDRRRQTFRPSEG